MLKLSQKLFRSLIFKDEWLAPNQFLLVGWLLGVNLMQLGAVVSVSIYTLALVLLNCTAVGILFLKPTERLPWLGIYGFSALFILLDYVNTGAIKESFRMGLTHTLYLSSIIIGYYLLKKISFFWFMLMMACAGSAVFLTAVVQDWGLVPPGIIYAWNYGIMLLFLGLLLLNIKGIFLIPFFLVLGIFVLLIFDRRSESFFLFGSVFVYLFLLLTKKRHPTTRVITVCLVFALAPIAYWFILPYLRLNDWALERRNASTRDRVEMVHVAIGEIKEAPLTGKSFNSRVEIGTGGRQTRFSTVHSIILQFGVYYGISGLVFTGILLIVHILGTMAYFALTPEMRRHIFGGRDLFAGYVIIMINYDWVSSLMAMKSGVIQGLSTGLCIYCISLYSHTIRKKVGGRPILRFSNPKTPPPGASLPPENPIPSQIR